MMQWAGLAAGSLAFVGIVGGFVKFALRVNAIWPDTAKQLGLVFKDRDAGNAFTSRSEAQQSVEGIISGVAIRAFEFRERVGGTTRSGTRVLGRALVPTERQFTFQLERNAANGPRFHVVDTGDPAFDRTVVLKSESPEDVRALLDPAVRTAMLWLTRPAASVSYDRGELCLAYGGTPSSQEELERAIRFVVAAASVRLA